LEDGRQPQRGDILVATGNARGLNATTIQKPQRGDIIINEFTYVVENTRNGVKRWIK